MRFHRVPQRVYLDVVTLPSGNVHVLTPDEAPRIPPPRVAATVGAEPAAGWVIHDATGVAVGPALASRAEALRLMGSLARRGVDLPLTLSDPDGRPTGDQLA